jgi:hypothetical protein
MHQEWRYKLGGSDPRGADYETAMRRLRDLARP